MGFFILAVLVTAGLAYLSELHEIKKLEED